LIFYFPQTCNQSLRVATNKKIHPLGMDLVDVARDGFEPPQTEPKSVVLPLDDRAKTARWVTTGAQK
jgi:hypothetical protein